MKVTVTFEISDTMRAAIMHRFGWKKATRADIASFIHGMAMADLDEVEHDYGADAQEGQ
jgi:hypothetical protein